MDGKLFIFIDESGDLGKFGTKYFSIVALSTSEVGKLVRVVKRIRMRKLAKKLKRLSEIKAKNSNEVIRRFVLTRIAQLHCSISVAAIQKTEVSDDLLVDKENVYNYLCGLLFAHISLNVSAVEITIDRKHGNLLLREDFNKYIEGKIREKSNTIQVSIRHLESHSCPALQAVDFVAWAINRKFSLDDPKFYDIIKPRIANAGREEVLK